MRTLLILLSIGLLVAGCVGSQPSLPSQPQNNNSAPTSPGNSSNATPAQPPAEQMTCGEYCPSQPHVQCVGTWNISGTYPACTCGFVCDAVPEEPENPAEPQEPIAVPTNLSVSELMQAGLEQEKDDFYRSNDGTYEEKTYTWLREGSGGLFGGPSPASDVKFNGEVIPSVLASGFIVFQEKGGSTRQAYGLAVFNTTRTFLDDFTNDAFDVDYFPQIIDKKLRDCWIYSKDFNLDSRGGWLQTYYFKCERAPDK